MQTTAAVFRSRSDAESAVEVLQQAGFSPSALTLLTPGPRSEETLRAMPTTDAEGPGVGPAIGGVVGGAAGAASGLTLATAVTVLVPGAGPVLVLGAVAASLLGLGGAIAGSATGVMLDEASATGVAADELQTYREVLAGGRSVVVVSSDDTDRLDAARTVLERHGGEPPAS
jgi:hypothetical protein